MEHSLWQFFVDHRPDLLVNVAKVLGTLGDETVLLPLTLLLLVAGLIRGRRSLLTVAPFAAMVSSYIIVGALKMLVNRSRPPEMSRLVEVSTRSMPSGHAAYAAALAAVVWICAPEGPRRRLHRTLAVTVAVAAGVARLVLGVHWAGDVVAGWAVGAAVGFGVVSVLRSRLQSVA